MEKVCRYDEDLLKCLDEKTFKLLESFKSKVDSEFITSASKNYAKRCDSLKDEKEKTDCKAKATSDSIKKELDAFKKENKKISYPVYMEILKFGLKNKFVNFPKEDMEEIKDGLLNFIVKHSASQHPNEVDNTGADKISPEFTKLFENFYQFGPIPRYVLLRELSINSKDQLLQYISKEFFDELKQKTPESKNVFKEESIFNDLKKPNPNTLLFKENKILMPIFNKLKSENLKIVV